MTPQALRAAILELAQARHPGTCCPSDVARSLRDDESQWRALMAPIREAALTLARDGRIEVLQRGQPATPPWRGPIRLRWRPQ